MIRTFIVRNIKMLVVLTCIAYLGLIPKVRATFLLGVYLLAIGHLSQFHQYLLSLGAWAPVVSVALMTAQSIAIPVPVTLLMVANGLAFGIWRGMLVSFIGAFLGAVSAYLLGRRLGRPAIQRFIPSTTLDAADRLMIRRGNWAVVLGRWVPGIPCDPISYVAGITKMPVAPFILLTVAGLVPANLLTALLGAESVGDVPTHYWIAGVLTVGLAVAAVWLYRAQRQRRLMRRADAP